MDSAPMVFVGTVISVEAIEDGTPEDDAWLWQIFFLPPLFFLVQSVVIHKKRHIYNIYVYIYIYTVLFLDK